MNTKTIVYRYSVVFNGIYGRKRKPDYRVWRCADFEENEARLTPEAAEQYALATLRENGAKAGTFRVQRQKVERVPTETPGVIIERWGMMDFTVEVPTKEYRP